MPYSLQWKDHTVTFEYYGEMTSQDILYSNRKVYGDPRFDDLRWQLVFVDAVDSVSFTEKDVKAIAYMDKAAARANSRIVVAFAGDSDLLKGLYTTYSKFIEGDLWPVYYFETRDEAIAYIEELKEQFI